MEGFKLITVHVLGECYYEARKILPLDELFQFYSSYEFKRDLNKQVYSIEFKGKKDVRLYDIGRNELNPLKINISAIVGKNGSGKSTILELMYAFCLRISKDQTDIKAELEEVKKNNVWRWKYINNMLNNLDLEVFYEVDGVIRSVACSKTNDIRSFNFEPTRQDNNPFNIEEFCYTIAINYSIYGLNETSAPWLGPMFHKNDGYQAPLTINPYRRDGNIDINKEYHLASSRLINNLTLYNEDNPEVINGQKLEMIKFSFGPKSLDGLRYNGTEFNIDQTINYYQDTNQKSIYDLFNKLSSSLVDDLINPGQIALFNGFKKIGTELTIQNYVKAMDYPEHVAAYIEYWFVRYIIKKIFKICLNYTWFRTKYIAFEKYGDKDVISIQNGAEDDLIKKLLSDKSHITLKLRQTFIMWKKRYFFEKITWGKITNENDPDFFECFCELDVSQLKDAVDNMDDTKSVKERFDLERVPGGILNPEVFVSRETINNSRTKIETLSSGEQQFLFTIQTILYHLKNLDSVFINGEKSDDAIKAYRNVQLVLDEVELYFHPEFQRRLIRELLVQIKQINLTNIKSINILFATHSPFILSDIPLQNTLRLKEGKPDPHSPFEQTFGANIHDLLANDFFMENGFMGAWSQKKIEETIQFLNYKLIKKRISEIKKKISESEKQKNDLVDEASEIRKLRKELKSIDIRSITKSLKYHEHLIELIGEPVIRDKIKNMFSEILDNRHKRAIAERRILEIARDAGLNVNIN